MNFKAFQGWRAGTETRFPSLLLDNIESLATQDFILSSQIVTGGGYPRVGTMGTTSHYLPNCLARPEVMRTVKTGKWKRFYPVRIYSLDHVRKCGEKWKSVAVASNGIASDTPGIMEIWMYKRGHYKEIHQNSWQINRFLESCWGCTRQSMWEIWVYPVYVPSEKNQKGNPAIIYKY